MPDRIQRFCVYPLSSKSTIMTTHTVDLLLERFNKGLFPAARVDDEVFVFDQGGLHVYLDVSKLFVCWIVVLIFFFI